MMMRTDFQATGHRPLDMKDFNATGAAGDDLPVHPRLSRPLARHDIAVTLVGAGCAVGVFALLALLFSLG